MPKPTIDYQKMLFASLLTIGIGVVLVIITLILRMVSIVVISESYASTIELVTMGYMILLYPAFFALYFWTGMRAAGSYGFDAVYSGCISAFSFSVVYVIDLALKTILAAVVSAKSLGSGSFSSVEMMLTSTLFGDVVGTKGLALSVVCGLGLLVLGAAVNFVLGGFGALYALRKSE